MIWSEFSKSNFHYLKKLDFCNDDFIKSIKTIRKDIINKEPIKYTINKVNIPIEKLYELKATQWVDPDLDFDYLDYEIHIKFLDNNIYIKTTKNKFNKINKRLQIFLNIINYINNNVNFNLYLILTNKKKYITDDIISSKNINSGYTNTLTNDIFIWREEEFEKVTFHEIIHLAKKDHRNENIELNLDIDGPESYYEAITDFKAIIYNLIYISLVTNKKLESLFKYELFFIKNQSYYINNNLKLNKEQNTPAYSYFVLKYKIFKYFIEEKFNNKIFNEIFYNNTKYNILINLLDLYIINEANIINFNSGRMTFFELN
jgi:hypothetical protein